MVARSKLWEVSSSQPYSWAPSPDLVTIASANSNRYYDSSLADSLATQAAEYAINSHDVSGVYAPGQPYSWYSFGAPTACQPNSYGMMSTDWGGAGNVFGMPCRPWPCIQCSWYLPCSFGAPTACQSNLYALMSTDGMIAGEPVWRSRRVMYFGNAFWDRRWMDTINN